MSQSTLDSQVDHRVCLACGYDLRGSASTLCPECGLTARDVKRGILRHRRRSAVIGSFILVGAVLLGLLHSYEGFNSRLPIWDRRQWDAVVFNGLIRPLTLMAVMVFVTGPVIIVAGMFINRGATRRRWALSYAGWLMVAAYWLLLVWFLKGIDE
jgi:predicted RNA-binding Zn-ribbon protein involved in translation (DUF1610 family)